MQDRGQVRLLTLEWNPEHQGQDRGQNRWHMIVVCTVQVTSQQHGHTLAPGKWMELMNNELVCPQASVLECRLLLWLAHQTRKMLRLSPFDRRCPVILVLTRLLPTVLWTYPAVPTWTLTMTNLRVTSLVCHEEAVRLRPSTDGFGLGCLLGSKHPRVTGP